MFRLPVCVVLFLGVVVGEVGIGCWRPACSSGGRGCGRRGRGRGRRCRCLLLRKVHGHLNVSTRLPLYKVICKQKRGGKAKQELVCIVFVSHWRIMLHSHCIVLALFVRESAFGKLGPNP